MPKFTYADTTLGEIVAYINVQGDLCIRPSVASHVPRGQIAILASPMESHRPAVEHTEVWKPEDPDNKAVFREGDSVTITF